MVEGQKELIKKLQNIAKKATSNVEQALIESALMVERDAKIKTPVDTGRLRQSISHETENFGSENPAVIVGTNVDYAGYIEFGTSKQPAQPYLYPALTENKEKIKKKVKQAIQKGVGL